MRRALFALSAVTAAFLAAPLLVVVPMSFSTDAALTFPPPGFTLDNYRSFFADPNWTGPLANSFLVGAATTLLTLALATPAAFALVRRRFPGKAVFNFLIMLPMIVPTIVMALGYYAYFGQLRIVQTYLGLVLAHTCLSLPIALLILTAALKGFDRSIEQAAMSLGASPLRTFRLITWPVLRPSFLIAGLFAFVHSFDETVISLFISGRDRATLPRQMFTSFKIEADPTISAASSLLFLMVLTGVAVVTAVRLTRRAAGRSA